MAAERRHVSVPRSQLLTYWLGESPRRITELALARVPFVPPNVGGAGGGSGN